MGRRGAGLGGLILSFCFGCEVVRSLGANQLSTECIPTLELVFSLLFSFYRSRLMVVVVVVLVVVVVIVVVVVVVVVVGVVVAASASLAIVVVFQFFNLNFNFK